MSDKKESSKPKKINIGLFYDFDLTLTEEYQQFPIYRHFMNSLNKKYGFTRPEQYFTLSDDVEIGIGYMEQMVKDTIDCFQGLSTDVMEKQFGQLIPLSPGLPAWFKHINDYCDDKIITPEHHVISVGISHLIKGTSIYPYLTTLNSGEFIDGPGGIIKINKLVDPFRKLERFKTTCKGADIHQDLSLEEYHINYCNTIVFGDGKTDKDIFRYARQRGGIAIGVFEKGNKEAFNNAMDNIGDSTNFIVPRDYSAGSVLEKVTLEAMNDMMNTNCDMDYQLVHNIARGQVRNKEIIDVVNKHLTVCDKCKKKKETIFYFS